MLEAARCFSRARAAFFFSMKAVGVMDMDALVVRAQGGEAWAVERLVEIWYPRLLRAAMSRLGNEQDAEDVVQETYLKLIEKVGTLLEPAAFPTWSYRILHHCCLDFLRRESRRRQGHRSLEAADTVSDTGSIDRLADPKNAAVATCLEDLGTESSQIVRLRLVLGLSVRETADVLGIPEGTVKSRLHTARARFRESFQSAIDS